MLIGLELNVRHICRGIKILRNTLRFENGRIARTAGREGFDTLAYPVLSLSKTHPASKATFPPAAVVFTVTVCSVQKRYK